MNSPAIGRTRDWRAILAAAVFACLPTVGAFGGGSYAALVIGLAAVLLISELIRRRGPEVDTSLAVVAGLFVVLLWVGVTWSIKPDRSISGALQMTGLAIAGIVFLGLRRTLADDAVLIFRALLIASAVGPTAVLLDIAVGHPILSIVVPPKPNDSYYFVKLGRGLGQLAILLWPVLAYAWASGRRRLGVYVVAAQLCVLAYLSYSNLAVFAAFVIGLVTLAVAAAAPRLVAYGLGLLTAVWALLSPFIIQKIGLSLAPAAEAIKSSARHRLEIWDYMTRRALERPLTGWGWQSAQALPVRPEEQARYEFFWTNGVPHPHDFWIQLWVETGVIGALLGLAFALLIVRRAWRQPAEIRPFALAACATAFALSLPSYNLATDSWWCALAATGMLFLLLPALRAER